MALRKNEMEKLADKARKDFHRANEQRQQSVERERAKEAAAVQEQTRAAVHVARSAALTRWEYQVKRIREGAQKGHLGSSAMEAILNAEGKRGWELVAIHDERATFKRPLPPDAT